MAKQKGIIKLKGTIGDITFYRSKDGYIARERTSIDATRIATDPAFQRTRENGAEFGRAGKATRVLRNTFKPYYKNYADSRMTSRLTQMMMKVIKADMVSIRGQRNVIDGEAELLQGFEFNNRGQLSNTLFAPVSHTIDRTTGEVSIELPSFIPEVMLSAPAGATHYRLVSSVASIDFEQEAFQVVAEESAVLMYNNVPNTALLHEHQITANSTHPIFLCFGVEFFQEVNGAEYALRNGSFNPYAIIKVDGGV